MNIRIKRVYDTPSKEDGRRILVDRLWPRGLSKEQARVDEWLKDIAPSAGLRKWFGHREDRWETFRDRYLEELEHHPAELSALQSQCRTGTVTLLYAAKDEIRNNAVVLREYLLGETLD